MNQNSSKNQEKLSLTRERILSAQTTRKNSNIKRNINGNYFNKLISAKVIEPIK
jgi:hypothetical protein